MENMLLIAVIFMVAGAGIIAFIGIHSYSVLEELKIPEDELNKEFLKETSPDLTTGANPNRESMGMTAEDTQQQP